MSLWSLLYFFRCNRGVLYIEKRLPELQKPDTGVKKPKAGSSF